MTTIAVGDVHGCGVELRGLLAAVDRTHRAARLVFVGDLLTKGPTPSEVLRELLDRREAGQEIALICGNHDLRMLAALVQVQSGVSPNHLGRTERACWQDLAKHGMLRLAMRLMVEASETTELRDPAGTWTIVHGGIDPALGLAGTPDDVKIHIKALDGEPHWWERYDGRDGLIVVGHKPLPEPMVLSGADGRPIVVNVDSGCVYGGWLSAYAIESELLFSVPSVQRGVSKWEEARDAVRQRSAEAAMRGAS
ncbi:MAG TPA: metallophosphoesterase [Phycisphaerales bacterium]|nr:metallophosphoesterase [Phycisphaerales bacterium]HMP36503.1 metallophosphoesterase [Phycisphaerales bacterium]